MASFRGEAPMVRLDTTFVLNVDELAALDALAGYGVEPFLKAFYEVMGKAYLQPHEAGLRSLFAAVRAEAPGILARAKRADEAIRRAEL